MIRSATIEDFDLVYSMGMKFMDQTRYKDISNPVIISSVIKHLIGDPGCTVLLCEDKGMIAGQVTPFIYGDGLVASELAWWVEPKHRSDGVGDELLKAFEEWAKQMGCHSVVMISLNGALDNYYGAHGYTIAERMYMKDIK